MNSEAGAEILLFLNPILGKNLGEICKFGDGKKAGDIAGMLPYARCAARIGAWYVEKESTLHQSRHASA